MYMTQVCFVSKKAKWTELRTSFILILLKQKNSLQPPPPPEIKKKYLNLNYLGVFGCFCFIKIHVIMANIISSLVMNFGMNLILVGQISGVNKHAAIQAPDIPNFPVKLRVIAKPLIIPDSEKKYMQNKLLATILKYKSIFKLQGPVLICIKFNSLYSCRFVQLLV